MAYCISKTLAGIPVDCQPSLGGISKIYIADFADAIFTLDASGNTITGVSSAATWYEFNFRQQTGNFTSTLQKGDNGAVYVETDIVAVFNRMETSKRLEMNALALNDMAVVVVDCNGKWWGFGVNRPVNSSAGTGESGTSFGDRNAYEITLHSVDGTFAPELTDEAITALKGKIYSGS